MTTEELLKAKWCWRKQGSGFILTTEVKGAVVVMATTEVNRQWDGDDPAETVIAVRDKTGVLVPLTPDHPVARAIRMLPDLISGCRCAADLIRDVKYDSESMRFHVNRVVEALDEVVARATGTD